MNGKDQNEWGIYFESACKIYDRLHGAAPALGDTVEFWKVLSPMMLWMDAICGLRSRPTQAARIVRLASWAERNPNSKHIRAMTPIGQDLDLNPVLGQAIRRFNAVVAAAKGQTNG